MSKVARGHRIDRCPQWSLAPKKILGGINMKDLVDVLVEVKESQSGVNEELLDMAEEVKTIIKEEM